MQKIANKTVNRLQNTDEHPDGRDLRAKYVRRDAELPCPLQKRHSPSTLTCSPI